MVFAVLGSGIRKHNQSNHNPIPARAKILVLYYSTYGHVETLANAIADLPMHLVNRKAVEPLWE